ncbi:unnamed protein product [Prorocentrum cordatum]|uniref:Uncharacterized protein n=1 Tax=Prorocentrum cordatum TaxID=2364126 RepID=A0ABN9X8Z0_9DINO|nr:unnamed protein product [Polarella glacialis]
MAVGSPVAPRTAHSSSQWHRNSTEDIIGTTLMTMVATRITMDIIRILAMMEVLAVGADGDEILGMRMVLPIHGLLQALGRGVSIHVLVRLTMVMDEPYFLNYCP